MDESRAAWRTFGDVDGTAAVGGAGPGTGALSERGAPGAAWAGPADAGRSWSVGPTGIAGDPAAGGPDDGRRHALRLLPVAIAAVACAIGAAAVLVIVLGTGGASAVVVDGGSAPQGPGMGPSASGEAIAGGDIPSDGPGASAGAVGSDADAIVVDVEGAVPRPGLVRLAPGARVGEAIAAAGGYAPTVDVARAAGEVNLAARVADGDRVRVPAIGDASGPQGAAAPGAPTSGEASAAPGLVDVNRASASELDALPGIGPVTAEKIIKARATAAFRSVQELRDRKVVTAATYAKIAPLVTVGP